MNGRLSVALVLGFGEDGRDVVVVLGEDLAFLVGLLGEEAEGFALSSSVAILSTDTATAAGSAISPPPMVIVVSALDRDVILSDVDQRLSCSGGLRLITCVRVC